MPIPANPWLEKAPRYVSLQAACEAAVVAEVANGELYVRLHEATDRLDILTVFGNLQEASQQRHLQAFQRCVQADAVGGGRLGGRRKRRGGGRV